MKIQSSAVAVSLLMLSGCFGASGTEGECKASVAEQLINPETMEFRDFTSVGRESAVTILAEIYQDQVDTDMGSVTRSFAEEAISNIEARTSVDGFYRARVRAEGRVGNTVTKSTICFDTTDDDCVCFLGGS